MNLCQILVLWPIPDLLDFSLVWNPTFGGALVTDNGGVQGGEDKFLSQNGCINVLEALEDSVDNGEMFPDK